MSSKNVLISCLAIMVVTCATMPMAIAQGQNGMWGNPHPGLLTPFAYPDQFSPDFQFFAPAEIDTFGGYPDANVGWFFTYERIYWNVTRPESRPQDFQGDFTWGNRYEMGFMTEQEHGWLVTYTHLDGPTVTSVNKANMESIEIDKTFQYRLHNGGFVEPYFGLRYINFKDFTGTTPQLDGTVENNMLGGQFGMRWFKKSGHWVLSVDASLMPLANFQHFSTASRDEFVFAGEVRARAAYEITRDLSLAVSYDLQHFGSGLARNNNLAGNDEDTTITGVGFGFEFNR